MSLWTHVAAVFQYDTISHKYVHHDSYKPDWDLVFGKQTVVPVDYESIDAWFESVDDAYNNPDKYMPFDSEGSLQRSVWENPKQSSSAHYTITIFGDLRDYTDTEEIKKWFERSCHRGWLRQGTCHVFTEGLDIEETWSEDFVYDEG